MNEINVIFEQLNKLTEKDLLKKFNAILFCQLNDYLKSECSNPNCRFLKNEYDFSNKLKNIVEPEPRWFIKFLNSVFPEVTKSDLPLLRIIDNLFDKKKEALKMLYNKDIIIVEEYLQYAKQALSYGKLFYYGPAYAGFSWTKQEFPLNMFNYLSYKIRLRADNLSINFLDEMKARFALIGLCLDDNSKTIKINKYFTISNDPFSFNIPVAYDDVKPEILMSINTMSQNENLFLRIADDVIKKNTD